MCCLSQECYIYLSLKLKDTACLDFINFKNNKYNLLLLELQSIHVVKMYSF